MQFFLKKYIKAPLALFVCLVLVLQMLPAPQPAQAGFWDFVKKILKGIGTPPNVTFTNDGRIKAGAWETDPLFKDENNKPTNPFSKLSLGGGSESLIDLETGQPAGHCWEAVSCYTEQGQVERVSPGALSNTEMYIDNTYAPHVPENAGSLVSPANVKQVLRDALGVKQGTDAYSLQRLRDGDEWRRVWAQYWLDLGTNILGATDSRVQGLASEISKEENKDENNRDKALIKLDKDKDASVVQIAILEIKGYLSPLAKLDDEKGIGSQNKDASIDNYAQDSKNKCCYIGKPIIPEECELSIKYPGDDSCSAACDEKRTPLLREACRQSCDEEAMAHRDACTHYIRLQKAGADIAFLAKKIYNSTNPLDECFFLKNCKSNCLLRYGEIKYVITWLDIAQFLLPTAWITVIKQVMGVIAALGQIKSAYEALSGLLTDGLTLISGFFDTFRYLQTMFTALQNIGGTMSASIGVASVAASALKETGILPIPVNALQFGAVAGAATVLAADSKGVNAMQGMLKRFSDNLLNYSTAKSETNKLLLGMRQSLSDVIEGNDKVKGAKHEIELAFFFEPNNPVRKDLDNMVGNLQTNFKSLSSLLDSAIGPGQLPIGPISELNTGPIVWTNPPGPPIPGSWQALKEDSLKRKEEPVLDFKSWEDGNGGVYVSNTAFGDKYIRNKDSFCSNDYEESDKRVCMFNGDRVKPWQNIVCPSSGALSGDAVELRDLTDPTKVKQVLKDTLGVGSKLNAYSLERLRDGDEWQRTWAQYWLELGTNILGATDSRVKNLANEMSKSENRNKTLIKLDGDKDADKVQRAILETKAVDYSYLWPLGKLDDENGFGRQNKDADIDNYAQTGALSNTETYLDGIYAPQRLQKAGFASVCAPAAVEQKTWLSNFKDIFTASSDLQANLKLVDPIYIRDMLIGENSVMDCAHKSGECKLDSDVKGWREYWETMARGLMVDTSGKDMKEKHEKAVTGCISKNVSLAPIAHLDSMFGLFSVESRDRGYYNKYDNPVEDILARGDLEAIQAAILNKRDSSDAKPFAFLASIAILDDQIFYNKYDDSPIRKTVFAIIDKYGLTREASGLFPAATSSVELKANLSEPDQELKVAERTKPSYLKNALDASLGCGCTFDSNAEEVSQEIFCDSTSNERKDCEKKDAFKYAVLNDSKTSWHYFWTRLGRIILQTEPQTDCDNEEYMKKAGTRAYIYCQIAAYELALDKSREEGGNQASKELAATIGGEISKILENITALEYQRNYLESPDRHTSPSNDREQRARHWSVYDLDQLSLAGQQAARQEIEQKGEGGSDYWQSQLWCAGGCKVESPPAGQLQDLRALVSPAKIKEMLRSILGTKDGGDNYSMENLNNKRDWVVFWQNLAQVVFGPDWHDNSNGISQLQIWLTDPKTPKSAYFIIPLTKLDNESGTGWQNKKWPNRTGDYDNYSKPGALANTEKYIDEVYAPEWNRYFIQSATANQGNAIIRFSESYEPDIVRYDWSARVNKVVNSVGDLNTIVYGLKNGLSPQNPAVIASIEKDVKEFADATEKLGLDAADFMKIRQRDCSRWYYFWNQEHYFKQYGGSSNCANCPCSNRSYFSYECKYPDNFDWTKYWQDPITLGLNWCKGDYDTRYCEIGELTWCKGDPEALYCNESGLTKCDCCSDRDNCNSQRITLENSVHPKCYVYIPECSWAEQNIKDKKILMDDCLAEKDESRCQDEINQYQWAQTSYDNCLIQRATYTAEEINQATAINQAASVESSFFWTFIGTWQQNFGGTTDPAKINDPNYYKNRYGYRMLRETEDLVLALQVVWQDDLTTVEAQERLARAMDVLAWKECKNGSWVDDPDHRCTGRVVSHNNQLDQILAVWQDVRRGASQSAPDSVARPAKDYAASIISSKIIAQEISSRVQQLKYLFEGYPGYPMNSPEVMRKKIASDLSYLSNDQKELLLEIISKFEVFYNTMKSEVVDTLDKAVGKYTEPSSSTVCPEGINEMGFLNRLACFEYCGGLPLDKCLDPKAEIKSHKFDDLMNPLSAIENIEDSIFLLTDATLDVNKISSIQESVDNLQPKIEAQNVVSINTNLVNDFNAKVSGKIKGILNKYNPLKEKGKDTNPQSGKVQLFNSSDGGPATFKDFANSLADNPLSFLEDQFNNIFEQFKTIKKLLEKAGGSLSSFYSGDRGGLYSLMANDIRNQKMPELDLKINGNESLVGACSALGIILQGDITEMNRVCSQKENGGELMSEQLRRWEAVDDKGDSKQKTCDIWLALADDITDTAMIYKEIADLQKLRDCVKCVKRNNNGDCIISNDFCIKCPTWICSGAGDSDPMCVMCKGVNNPQGCVTRCLESCSDNPAACDRTVCKGSGIALFDVKEFPTQGSREWPPTGANVSVPPVSNIPTTAICEGLGFMSSPLCTVTKVNDRCQTMDNFLGASNCTLFDSCSPAELQRQADIKKWRDQSAANKCPKWFCLNNVGNWQGAAGVSIDPYCVAHCGVNDKQGDGMVCSVSAGIIWDTNVHPTAGDQVWPPVKTPPYTGTQDSAMRTKCIEAQKGLRDLGVLDAVPSEVTETDCSPLQPIIPFCQDKTTCNSMKEACSAWAIQKAEANTPITTNEQSGEGDYQGATLECVRTQETIMALKQVMADIEKAAGNEPQFRPDVLDQLNSDCNELKRQQELKKECDSYALAKKAVANKCDSDACRGKRTQMNQLCALNPGQSWTSNRDYCDDSQDSQLENLLLDTAQAKANLQKVRSRCMRTLDIRTPLGEIMKVLSILMGIQSGTAAHGGIVSSIQGARVFYENVGKFIKMIEGLKDAMGKAYDDTMANSVTGGFKFNPKFKCVAMPAESSIGGQTITGPNGGPVCPEVGNIYSQIQADFAAIRQEAKKVEQAMYKTQGVDVPLPWGEDAYVHLFDKYVNAYPSIKPMSDRAQGLREEAQFVWAMATAINFANSRCTCGMSYCKLPFCISGLPLTLAPLKDPYCALVWMLRTPMIDLGNRLAEDLNKKLDKVK